MLKLVNWNVFIWVLNYLIFCAHVLLFNLASSLISPEKFKGQRPESGCVPGRSSPCHPSRWQSTLSTSSGELTIGDNSLSSSVSSSSGKGTNASDLLVSRNFSWEVHRTFSSVTLCVILDSCIIIANIVFIYSIHRLSVVSRLVFPLLQVVAKTISSFRQIWLFNQNLYRVMLVL